MRRLVCVVEGHGEADAVPVLCHRILKKLLHPPADWHIEAGTVRMPRSKLVDERSPGPKRGPNVEGLDRALRMAGARDPAPHGILVICDADDDCPASWGGAFPTVLKSGTRAIPSEGVMASREFESWILWGHSTPARRRAGATAPESAPRDAKGAVKKLVPGSKPTVHPKACVRALDLKLVWGRSDSFDKLVRSIASLVGSEVPKRPTAQP